MSDFLAALEAQANEVAAVSLDMTEVISRGTSNRLLPVGYAYGRLVEYTEYGMQKQEFQGKAQEPAMEVQLGFALYGEGYQNEDGSPYILRLFPFALKQNDGARSFKLFKSLNYDGTKTHFGQLLGKAWLVKIVHEPKTKADPTLVSRIDLAGFLPPMDPVTKAPYAIPMPEEKYFRAFFWNKPTLAAWDALKIEASADGKVRNFIQETIMGAVDYEGSQLQALLGGGSAVLALPGAAPLAQAATAPVSPAVAPVASSAPATVVTPAPVTAIVQPAEVVAPVIPAVVNPVVAPEVAAVAAPLAQPVVASVAQPSADVSSQVVAPVLTVVQPAVVPPVVVAPLGVAPPATTA